jgi:hypothetical protein
MCAFRFNFVIRSRVKFKFCLNSIWLHFGEGFENLKGFLFYISAMGKILQSTQPFFFFSSLFSAPVRLVFSSRPIFLSPSGPFTFHRAQPTWPSSGPHQDLPHNRIPEPGLTSATRPCRATAASPLLPMPVPDLPLPTCTGSWPPWTPSLTHET